VIREIFIHGWGYHDLHTQKMLEARFSSFPPIMAYINRSRMIVPDFERLLTNERAHVENISLMFPSQEERDACFRRLIRIRTADDKRLLQVLVPWKTDLEITHVLADKWRSLEGLGRHLGITDAQIMTLGDGDNDRPMLRGAGLSVAMGNAPDFVKETADRITEDNEHDGAAAAIRQVLGY
jgi:hydroxymethylpyrimidine pyrophosphatase-like HAD family hydrolase